MIVTRRTLLSVAAAATLTLQAPCQVDSFEVALDKSATSCKLTATILGPANGRAILLVGQPGGAHVETPPASCT